MAFSSARIYGSSGYSGYSGVSGYSGANPGDSGYSGYSGGVGSAGSSGYSGYSGRSGYSGYSGISGYSGSGGWGTNVMDYGAVGDGTTDDTTAIQNAVNAIESGSSDSPLYFPPGVYKITDTISFGAYTGMMIQGSGSQIDVLSGWNSLRLGSTIKASGMDTKPMFDFYGSANIKINDLTLYGNTSNSLTGAAAFGIRIRGKTSYGGGPGQLNNVSIFWCDEGINAGDSDDGILASDFTYTRCLIQNCTTGFRCVHVQAVNHAFDSCMIQFCTYAFRILAGNLYASMLATYDVQKIVYIDGAGPNLGHVTIMNCRADGTAYRTIFCEFDAAADGVMYHVTFIDPSSINGQPDDNTPRFKVRGQHFVKVIGGNSLCYGGAGPLFETTGGTGYCSFLAEGAVLPASSGNVVGTVAAGSQYIISKCVDESTFQFIPDYGNITLGTSGYSGYSGSTGTSGYSGYSGSVGQSGYSGYSGVGTSGYSGYSGNGLSGYSGYSGIGTSGYSGYSGNLTNYMSGRISGYFYPANTGGFGTNGTITQDKLFALPFYVGASQSFDRIAITSIGAASSVVRLGIYNDGGGKPGTLLADYGTVDTSTLGAKTITINITVSGLIWLAAVAQTAAASVNRIAAYASPFCGTTDIYSVSWGAMAYSQSSVTGGLPSPWGSTYNIEATANTVPNIFLRAS